MLHVTNGGAVVGTLAASGLPGDRLAWDDVLHEGPVREGLSEADLRAERARFLAIATGETPTEAEARLERRDRRLAEAAGHEKVALWFEADLLDQLQILQILDRLEPDGAELICIGDHPSTDRFYGLGQLESPELPPLFELREPVSHIQVDLAQHAWEAFREPTPGALERLRDEDISALPFLAEALRRLLEELPWTTDGLSRTDRSLLAPLGSAPGSPADIFRASMAAEERPFLSDTYAIEHLKALSAGARPLLVCTDGERYAPGPGEAAEPFLLRLTEDGTAVLAGDLDAVHARGDDRWLGGTRLTPTSPWRWDPRSRRVAGL